MKEGKSTFKTQDKNSWKSDAISMLKGQSFESIQCEIEPGLVLDPLFVEAEIDSFDPIFWPTRSEGWKIVESFEVTNNLTFVEINQAILDALDGGCEVLDIKLDPTIQLQPDILLNEVLLELITIRIELSDDQKSVFVEFVDEYASNKKIDWINLSIQIVGDTTLFYEMKNDDVYTVQLTNVIKAVENHLANLPNTKWNSINIQVPIGNHFLAEVSKIRALKLLIHGLADKLRKPLKDYPTISAKIIPSQIKHELETLIERTTSATSAALGGVDEISIVTDFDTEMNLAPADKRRVNRNIHWLLKKESQLPMESDTLNGAYWIEFCTREFVNRVWQNIKTGGER